MKWTKLLLCISIIITIFSCHKSNNEPQLIVSKTKVKMGEMIIAKVIHQPAGTLISWYPSNQRELINISADGKMARVLFIKGHQEEYTLQAGLHKGDSIPYTYLSKTIEIENDYFKFPDNLPENGVQPVDDRLRLCPLLMKDNSLSFAFYSFPSVTCFNSYLVVKDVNISNGNIKATINQVWAPDHCEPEPFSAWGELFTKHVYQDGSYSIELNFGNKLYQGTLEVSNNAKRYTFKGSTPSFLDFGSFDFDFIFSYTNGGSFPTYTVNKF